MSLRSHVSYLHRRSSFHQANVSSTEVWTLYKEVQTYYSQGLIPPDDMTLMFSDDNWGNIQRLPLQNETARAGGIGVSLAGMSHSNTGADLDRSFTSTSSMLAFPRATSGKIPTTW